MKKWLLLAVLLVGGCKEPKKELFDMCGANSQCKSHKCFENVCSKECRTDADCGPDRYCMEGTLQVKIGTDIPVRMCH